MPADGFTCPSGGSQDTETAAMSLQWRILKPIHGYLHKAFCCPAFCSVFFAHIKVFSDHG